MGRLSDVWLIAKVSSPTWTDVTSAVASILTLAIVLIGLLIAWHQLGEAKRTRRAGIMIELSKRWDETPLVESRRAFHEKYGSPEKLGEAMERLYSAKSDELYMLLRLPDYLEDLAILVEEGGTAKDVVRKSLGSVITTWWTRWEPAVRVIRAVDGDTVYEHLERLAEQMREH